MAGHITIYWLSDLVTYSCLHIMARRVVKQILEIYTTSTRYGNKAASAAWSKSSLDWHHVRLVDGDAV